MTQRASENGQTDVIDGRSRYDLPCLLQIGEIASDVVPDTLSRDRPDQARLRNLERVAVFAFVAPDFVEGLSRQRRGVLQDEAGNRDGFRDRVQPGPSQELTVARKRLRSPAVHMLHRAIVGARLMDRVHELDTGHAVDGGMVDLQHGGEAAFGKTFDSIEALDHGHFPRWSTQVEGTSDESGDLGTELLPVSRRGQRDMSHVVGEVEVGVLDPIGIVQIHGDANEASAEGGRDGEADPNRLDDVFEGRGIAGAGRRVEDVDHVDVERRSRRLHEDHRRVDRTQLLHVSPRDVPNHSIPAPSHCRVSRSGSRTMQVRRSREDPSTPARRSVFLIRASPARFSRGSSMPNRWVIRSRGCSRRRRPRNHALLSGVERSRDRP